MKQIKERSQQNDLVVRPPVNTAENMPGSLVDKRRKKQFLTMKQMPADDRPVEKILHQGVEALSDAELLAVLIRSGSRDETALSLCQRLIGSSSQSEEQSRLLSLQALSLEELMQFPGIGPVKAAQIKAALEIGQRASRSRGSRGQSIRTPDDAIILLDAQMRHLPREELRMVLLDTRSRLIKTCCISRGGLAAAVIFPRDIFREALKANASSMILAHNHRTTRS